MPMSVRAPRPPHRAAPPAFDAPLTCSPPRGAGGDDRVKERLDKWLSTAKTLGFKLSEDQVEALRCLATANDVLYVLATGAGKSLVYLLPLLTSSVDEAPLALYIAPLNSLIQDQHRKAMLHAKHLNLQRFAVRGGGRNIKDEVDTDEDDGASSGEESEVTQTLTLTLTLTLTSHLSPSPSPHPHPRDHNARPARSPTSAAAAAFAWSRRG